jgi:hypothetical protein
MADLSRRIFLFGSAAALAAAAAPKLPLFQRAIEVEPFVPVPALSPFRRRLICDFTLEFEPMANPGVGELWVFRGKNCLHNVGMSELATYRWCAMPGYEWIVLPDQPLRMELRSRSGLGRVDMICHDYVDDGPPIDLMETHTFPQRGPAIVNYLEADNSLETRVARAKARFESDVVFQELSDDDDPGTTIVVPATVDKAIVERAPLGPFRRRIEL